MPAAKKQPKLRGGEEDRPSPEQLAEAAKRRRAAVRAIDSWLARLERMTDDPTDLARRTGVGYTTWRGWVNKGGKNPRRSPKAEDLYCWADALGLCLTLRVQGDSTSAGEPTSGEPNVQDEEWSEPALKAARLIQSLPPEKRGEVFGWLSGRWSAAEEARLSSPLEPGEEQRPDRARSR